MAKTSTLPASLTVSYILENTEQSNDGTTTTEEKQELEEKVVTDFLTANGITLSESKADQEAAYRALHHEANADFWVKHYSLHPNQSRVKNWLWVHGRYRDQASEIAKAAEALPNDNPTAAAKKLLASFNKFTGKIKSHSEFEDTQLFKFFLEERIGSSSNSDVFKALMEEHANVKQVNEIEEIVQKMIKDPSSISDLKGELIGKISDYVNDLEAHLKEEEHTIVALWLQLTPAQYKKYRSYLSWKYAMMY